MSKLTFTQDGEEHWVDVESGEYEYDGPDALVRVLLEYVDEYEKIETGDQNGMDDLPGEVWKELSPEERREKVSNYLTRISGVEINE